jgi:hypothetical protein
MSTLHFIARIYNLCNLALSLREDQYLAPIMGELGRWMAALTARRSSTGVAAGLMKGGQAVDADGAVALKEMLLS